MKTEKRCDNCKYGHIFAKDDSTVLCIRSMKENKRKGVINVKLYASDQNCRKWESK
mgnify:CR=1 FL=1